MPLTQESPSTIAAYTIAIAAALKQSGIDPQEVFTACELPIQTLTDPMHRLSNKEVNLLFSESIQRTGNPTFGLLVGEAVHPGNLHALGYALMSSTTLRDFCERLKNYFRIASQNAVIHTEENGSEFTLITQTPSSDVCWETQDAYSSLIVRFVRFNFNDFSFNSMDLMRPDPGELRQRYEDYFRCPINYGSDQLAFRFNVTDMDLPLPGASRELTQLHDQTTMQYLKKLEKADVVNRVRTTVVEDLASHALTKQHVADRLCMSSRSLQMKLAAQGTSFQEILDSTRKSLAIAYMEQCKTTITEAAYLLGFSEVNNFTRAFKRWTGKSPREFRQSLSVDH